MKTNIPIVESIEKSQGMFTLLFLFNLHFGRCGIVLCNNPFYMERVDRRLCVIHLKKKQVLESAINPLLPETNERPRNNTAFNLESPQVLCNYFDS